MKLPVVSLDGGDVRLLLTLATVAGFILAICTGLGLMLQFGIMVLGAAAMDRGGEVSPETAHRLESQAFGLWFLTCTTALFAVTSVVGLFGLVGSRHNERRPRAALNLLVLGCLPVYGISLLIYPLVG